MSATDLSLRQNLAARGADPAQGVRAIAPAGAALNLRALIPLPIGGGAGGGPGDTWGKPVSWEYQATATVYAYPTTSPCALTEVYLQRDGATILNTSGTPLMLGDSYRLSAQVHFLAHALPFLQGVGPLPQDFVFDLHAILPDGTTLTPDSTIWYAILPEDIEDAQLSPLKAPGGNWQSPAHTGESWQLMLPYAPTGLLPYGWHLQRGEKLVVQFPVISTAPFAANLLGIVQRSLVGTIPGPEIVGDTVQMLPHSRAFCRNCQRIVILTEDDACSVCGKTGTWILQPVAPRIVSVMTPLFFA